MQNNEKVKDNEKVGVSGGSELLLSAPNVELSNEAAPGKTDEVLETTNAEEAAETEDHGKKSKAELQKDSPSAPVSDLKNEVSDNQNQPSERPSSKSIAESQTENSKTTTVEDGASNKRYTFCSRCLKSPTYSTRISIFRRLVALALVVSQSYLCHVVMSCCHPFQLF